jgi:competence protein ComEC
VAFLFILIAYLIKRVNILLFIVIFFSSTVYQASRTPQRGAIVPFRGIYIDNRILDPIWGELYVKLPNSSGDFVRGNGKFIESKTFTKLVDVEINSSFSTILNRLFSLRNSLVRKIQIQCPGDIGKMCATITLGIRETLPSYLYNRFQSSGAAHLLAVSGLHTGIVFAVFFVLLRALQLKRTPALLLSEIFVLIYAVFTGFRVPVLRASIMLFFFVVGEARSENIEPLNILSAAGIFIVLIMPKSIFSISFQLSFLAVFSILLILDILKEQLEKIPNRWFKYWIVIPFLVTLSAQLGTLPLVAYYFGYIPLIGLIANLVLVPLTGALLSGCFLFFLFPFLSNITGNFVWIIGFTMNNIMIIIERIPCAILRIRKNEPKILLIYLIYLIIIILLVYREKKKELL